jgi:hypothetical protein
MADADSQINEAISPALSWSSIIAGAIVIAATSFILVTVSGGLELSLGMSPDQSLSTGALSAIAAIWLIVTQWIASGVGGYMTGRLRTKWTRVHTHEVFFRDTAHGFMAWATATLFGILILSSTAATMLGHSMTALRTQQIGGGQQGAKAQVGLNDPLATYIDSLYRPAHEGVPVSRIETGTSSASPATEPSVMRVSADVRAETGRILLSGTGKQGLADNDKFYLAQLISANTDLSPADAAKRIDDVLAKAHDDMRKVGRAAGYLSLFVGLSMMVGAFIAAVAAAFGGSQRDEWEEAVRAGTYGDDVRRPA